MKLNDLINKLLSFTDQSINYDVGIVINSNTCPATPIVDIKSVQAGFDFDNGKILICPSEPLRKELKNQDECVEAWRTLHYNDLLSSKEKESISKKISKKFKLPEVAK